ncbi:hypothetical protein ACFQ9Q_31630 [Streptomyces virginiae]|uniref:hypothetical protein n=1 Tax=Streptomyces virginiae TaxID=1961 RepID=UPI003676E118
MTGGAWSPVVLGRLRYVDQWWRELPEGVRADGWLGATITAAVQNGRDLEHGRRMVFARQEGRVLVGGACDAELLSERHRTDSGGRPLYCFVGWLGPADSDAAPTLDRLAEGYQGWASELYERAVEPVWEAKATPEPRGPSPAGPAPWGREDRAPRGPEPLELPHAAEPGVWLLPAARAGAYWDAAVRSTEPCILMTGWHRPVIPARSPLTHVCAAGIEEPVFRSAPAPRRLPPPAEPQPVQTDPEKLDPEEPERPVEADSQGEPLPRVSDKPDGTFDSVRAMATDAAQKAADAKQKVADATQRMAADVTKALRWKPKGKKGKPKPSPAVATPQPPPPALLPLPPGPPPGRRVVSPGEFADSKLFDDLDPGGTAAPPTEEPSEETP